MFNRIKSLIAVFIFLTAANTPLFALELGVGMTADYSWWRPPYEGEMMIPKDNFILSSDNTGLLFDTTGAANYGLLFSIKLHNGLSFTASFRYGKYHLFNSAGSTNVSGDLSTVSLLFRKITANVQKFNPYAHIAYFFNEYLGIYAGFHARIFRYKTKFQQFERWNDGFEADANFSLNNYIPEIGISFQLPIYEGFSIGLSLSGLALWGTEEVTKAKAAMQGKDKDKGTWQIVNFKRIYPKGTYFAYGFDSSLSFTYRIQPINTELSLGARYGLLRYMQKNKERSVNLYNENHEYTYTIFFSASYIFVL